MSGKKLIFLFLIYLFLFSSVAYGDEEGNPPEDQLEQVFTVVPTKIESMIAPGEETIVTMTLKNDTPRTVSVRFTAWDFARDDNGAPIEISKQDSKNFRGAASWIELPSNEIIVNSGEHASVDIKIKVPEKSDGGTHYSYVKIKAEPLDQIGAIKVNYVINTLFLPIVLAKDHGDEQQRLKIGAGLDKFKTSNTLFLKRPIKFISKINNEGNTHLTFSGDIEVRQGKKLFKKIPVEYTLLPDQVSVIMSDWEEFDTFGKFTARLTGTAKLKSSFQEFEIKGKSEFWYFPQNFIIGVSAGLFIILVGSIWFLRHYLFLRKKVTDSDEEAADNNILPETSSNESPVYSTKK